MKLLNNFCAKSSQTAKARGQHKFTFQSALRTDEDSTAELRTEIVVYHPHLHNILIYLCILQLYTVE